ncbi:MAG: hypothetical protein Q9160_001725 [Pyrenula sp. 1 TL-2023]
MGTLYHISESISWRFIQNKASAEYEAISAIAELFPHPERTILSSFVQQALDREVAARFLLDEISGKTKAALTEFLATWGKLYKMFAAFIGESQLRGLCSLMNQNSSSSGQLILLSSRMFEHFKNGRISFKASKASATEDSARYSVKTNNFIPSIAVESFHFVTFENKAAGVASLPRAQLLAAHHLFADALAWLEVSKYMKEAFHASYNDTQLFQNSTGSTPAKRNSLRRRCVEPLTRILRHLWIHTPVACRVFTYKYLGLIANRFYRHTGSDWTFRLPFNLYLRVADCDWAPKHRAECRTLQLVEQYIQVPAPRALDAVQNSHSSFLLMTGLPGQRIGSRLHTMTDRQIYAAVEDLIRYIAELRKIPKEHNSYPLICNALGTGILDWRIADSQREELTFQDEASFHRYLTSDLPLDEDAWKTISKSHGVKHDIVFTHADLNPRNILVDESGRICGIVDWECAGWYPEYWEFTKAHFTVRVTIRWIADVINQVFPGYRNELEVEGYAVQHDAPLVE